MYKWLIYKHMGRFGPKREKNFNKNQSSIKHQTVCSECGKPCEVPFRPTQGKPVYCDDCFRKRREKQGSGGRFPQKNFNRQRDSFKSEDNSELKKILGSLNTKMEELIKKVTILTDSQVKPKEKKETKKDKKTPGVKVKKLVKKISKK